MHGRKERQDLVGPIKNWFWMLPRLGTAAAGLFFLWTFASLTLDRVPYAGELEWMEGGILDHVHRVASGKPLYAEPSIDFTPFIYPPFYYWFCALVTSFLGESVPVLRGISLACFGGSLAVIVAWNHRVNRSWLAGIVGAGLFGATFKLGGSWFDVARTDSMLVFFLLLGAFLLFCFEGKRSAVLAGLFFFLAALTKQSALLPLALTTSWAILTRARRGVLFGAIAIGLSVLTWLVLQISSDGWFSYYLFEIPAAHEVYDDWKWRFWTEDIGGVLLIPSLLLLAEILCSLKPGRLRWRNLGFAAFSTGVVLLVYSSRTHAGMFANVLMPLHALTGLGTALLLGRVQQLQGRSRVLEFVAVAGLLFSFYGLRYRADAHRPTRSHQVLQSRLEQQIAPYLHDAWVPFHGGHSTPRRAHVMAIIDIIRGDEEQGRRLTARASEAFSKQRFSAVVWSGNSKATEFLRAPMFRHYRLAKKITSPPPLTGWGQQIQEVWLPRRNKDTSR